MVTPIRMDDFRIKRTDGEDGLDWDFDAYHRAQVANGEQCHKCGGLIVYPTGSRSLCDSCRDIDVSNEDVRHGRFIRCPKCGHVRDMRDGDSYELMEEGEHPVSCDECGNDFEISTHVTIIFTSPARVKEEESS